MLPGRPRFSLRISTHGALLEAIFYRLPARPLVKWTYMMFIRRAILDGRAGIAYANLQAIYEYFIVLKSRELTQNSP
jgi:hypothetical protein